MSHEDKICKIITEEFEKLILSIKKYTRFDNTGTQSKIQILKIIKDLEITKSNIVINIKNYFIHHKSSKTNNNNQLNQNLADSKKRNKSQFILNIPTTFANQNKRNLSRSIIEGNSSEQQNSSSYLSQSVNKKILQIKTNTNSKPNNKAIKTIIDNNYNNNILSSGEHDNDIKMMFTNKKTLIKNYLNNILNKTNSDLKNKIKEKKINDYSFSNKVTNQKKKINMLDDIVNGTGDTGNSRKKNMMKIATHNNIGISTIGFSSDKNHSFLLGQNKNSSTSKNKKKKVLINKINIQNFRHKTKTEVINKKKKILSFSSNNLAKKKNNENNNINTNNTTHNNYINVNNSGSKNTIWKISSSKDKEQIRGTSNSNNKTTITNNYIGDNIENEINNNTNFQELAKEIVYFLDNMKNLQENIIKKGPEIKKMKHNFEKQKVSLYQKASKLINNNTNNNIINDNNINDNNINDNIIENSNINESKLDICNNSKGNIVNNSFKSDSISLLKNYLGDGVKNCRGGITIKNINNNLYGNNDNNTTKELNLSIANLRKTIEDIKNNEEIITEKLKKEIKTLNEELENKNTKEKKLEKQINEYVNKIKNIYKILLLYENVNATDCYKKVSNSSSDKKMEFYLNEVTKIVETYFNGINVNNTIKNNFDEENNIIKNELFKTTTEIITWIKPYLIIKDDEDKLIYKLKNEFNNYGVKEALNALKYKIKELVFLVETYSKKNLNINKTVNTKINEFTKLNDILLKIQNDLICKLEKNNNEIKIIKSNLNNSLKINKKILNFLGNFFPNEMRFFEEKYEYIYSLYTEEQDKVELLKSEYINIVQGLIDYIHNGDKIKIQLGKMWNIKAKKQNFELTDPDSVELSHINESDLLSSSSKRMDSIKNRKGNGCRECEIYIEEIEKYKKNINTFHILINNIGNILTKTIKDLKLNQKQKEMFVGIFKMLEGKNNDDKK